MTRQADGTYNFQVSRFVESSDVMAVLRKLPFAIAACVLLGEVGLGSVRSQSLLQTTNNANGRFDFHHYESLPKDSKVREAQAEVERLFPSGSSADDFEAYFKASGAKCSRVTDYYGPGILCDYSISVLLQLITTDWMVVARQDAALSKITTVLVTREATGP
jgi:hypothetical protein